MCHDGHYYPIKNSCRLLSKALLANTAVVQFKQSVAVVVQSVVVSEVEESNSTCSPSGGTTLKSSTSHIKSSASNPPPRRKTLQNVATRAGNVWNAALWSVGHLRRELLPEVEQQRASLLSLNLPGLTAKDLPAVEQGCTGSTVVQTYRLSHCPGGGGVFGCILSFVTSH